MCIYLWIINLIGFIVMGIDKHKARHNNWRIREKTLIIISIIGGSLGMYLGMFTFKHKTRHLKFVIGIPIIILLQGILLFFYFNK